MTLLIGEGAFYNCPLLRRIGTTDTSQPTALNMVLPGGATIGKDAFTIPHFDDQTMTYSGVDLRKIVINTPSTVTIDATAGFNELDIRSGDATVSYTNVTDTVSHKLTSAVDFNIGLAAAPATASISLEISNTGGRAIFDSLKQVPSLTINAMPTPAAGLSIGSLFTSANILQSLTLPTTNSAFLSSILNAPALKKLTLDATAAGAFAVTDGMFKDKTLLEEIVITGRVSSIGAQAFAGCTNLKKMMISEVAAGTSNPIGEFAFAGCSNLETVQIGAVASTIDVTAIERGAFYKCAKLLTVKFTDRLKKIGDVAFMDSGISGEVVIPKNVSSHGAFYFFRCNNLTKLKYLCNLLDFTDPTTINLSKMQKLVGITSNTVMFEINGDIIITPGKNVPTHTFTYNGNTTMVNDDLFLTKYNAQKYTDRNQKYKDIIVLLYSMQDQIPAIKSILELSPYIPFKTANAAKANKVTQNLDIILENIQNFTYYIQEYANDTLLEFYETAIPKMQDEISTTLDTLISEIMTILTDANIPSIQNPIQAIMTNSIAAPRNEIIRKLAEIRTLNDTIRQNGDVSVYAPYYITKNESFVSTVNVTLPTSSIIDYTGASTIIKENGFTYMKYSSSTIENTTTLAGFELSDTTRYGIDGWFRYKMDDYYSKYHIEVITDILSIIQSGSYNNKDIDYELTAPKLINIINLKNYKGVNISINAPAVIIGECAMEELSDVTLTLNATTLRIEDGAFVTSQNIKLNITSETDIICGKNILMNSSLITINTNKDLTNIPAEPIILNNISINYWDKNIKELLDIIKNETSIDTTTAYDVEYTTFTAVGSVNPIFAISFRTSTDLKEYTVIIPPLDYYWTFSIGEVYRDARDFSYGGRNMIYYPDQAMRDSRSAEWKHNNNALLGMINTDNYGLTNNFAPASFTFKGYTFVQKEKVENRTMRQVCSNYHAALSERSSANALATFFLVLDIIGIITMVIPIGDIVKAVTLPIRLFFTSTRIGLAVTSRVARIGQMIVKTASIITDKIKKSRVFIKAGKNKELLKKVEKVGSCAVRDGCIIRQASRNSATIGNNTDEAIKMMFNPMKSGSSGASEALPEALPISVFKELGDDVAVTSFRDLPRSSSIRNAGQIKVTIKPNAYTSGAIERKLMGQKHIATVTRGKPSSSAVTKIAREFDLSKIPKPKRKLGNFTRALLAIKMNNLRLGYERVGRSLLIKRIKEFEKLYPSTSKLNQNEYKLYFSKNTTDDALMNGFKLPDADDISYIAAVNRQIRYQRIKIAAIATAVSIAAIGTAVGITMKQRNRNISDTISSHFATFNTAMTTANTDEEITAHKNTLIAALIEEFRSQTDLNITEATTLVTDIVNFITASEDDTIRDNYAAKIMDTLTEIVNTNDYISSSEAVDLLNTASQLLISNDLFETNVNSIETLATASDGLYHSTTVGSTFIPGFNDYSLKHIAMYKLFDNMQYLGVTPDESNTPVVSASDSAALEIPATISQLMSDTEFYSSPPYMNPMPYRNSNIRTFEDTYKDNLRSIVVKFNENTKVSYVVNETWKDKFDVIIENAPNAYIYRNVLVNVNLNNVRYMRIVSPSFGDYTSNERTYTSPDKIEYCIDPPSWLAVETYLGFQVNKLDDQYLDRDEQGQINAPYTVANPLLLNDNYMWLYTKLRTFDVANIGDYAALQVPFVQSSDGLTPTLPPAPIPHKSGLYMGWNSVKYELSTAEDTVMNMALGGSNDIIINYVNSTQTTIPAYAYSSCGISPVSDAGPFSIIGVTLPMNTTSIGKKAFYRSGLDFAIIPPSMKTIAAQAFAEAGVSNVKFLENPNIKVIPGGDAYIGAGGSTYKLTYKDISQIPAYRNEVVFNRADVLIENPGSFRVGNITYSNIDAVIMLRANVNVLTYWDGPNTYTKSTIFNSAYANDGLVGAETYIILDSGNTTLTIDGYNAVSQIVFNNNSTTTYSNITDFSEYNGVVTQNGYIVADIPSRYTANVTIKNPTSITIHGITYTGITEIGLERAEVYKYVTNPNFNNPTVKTYDLPFLTTSSPTIDFVPPTSGNVVARNYIFNMNLGNNRAAPRAIEDSIDIGPNAFADNVTLETLTLPATLRSIGDSAFAGCTALTTVELPPLKTIGNNVFADCTALTSVSIPPNVESLGANVFENCPALTTVAFRGVPPATIDPGFFTSIAALNTPVTITVPPQYVATFVATIKASGIDLGSSSSTLTVAVDTSTAIPTFPMSLGPDAIRVRGTLYAYSSAAMESLQAGLAIDPATKYVSWLTDGAAYDGMMIRPLGRRVHIYTTDRVPLLRYVFTNVKLISTTIMPSALDRDPYLTGWVCTWSADGIYPML